MRRILALVSLAAAAAFVLAPIAPVGAQTDHATDTEHQGVDDFVDTLPCAGDYELHLVYNAIEHYTSNKNGFWETFTENGTFETGQQAINVVRDDEGEVVDYDLVDAAVHYTGHFTVWGNFNANPREWNSTFTFSGHGTGDDGSTVNWNSKAHINTTGDITRHAFDTLNCHDA